jgi:hypothetical protein
MPSVHPPMLHQSMLLRATFGTRSIARQLRMASIHSCKRRENNGDHIFDQDTAVPSVVAVSHFSLKGGWVGGCAPPPPKTSPKASTSEPSFVACLPVHAPYITFSRCFPSLVRAVHMPVLNSQSCTYRRSLASIVYERLSRANSSVLATFL